MSLAMLAFGYGLIEGPRVDAAGHLYFSIVTVRILVTAGW
jgi:hypothetical protein